MTARRFSRPRMARQGMVLPAGLTRAAVLKIARKRASRDFRGFIYDKKTGWTVLT